MSADERTLVTYQGQSLLRAPCTDDTVARGEIVEAWLDGRGPRHVLVGGYATGNKRFSYFHYSECSPSNL